MSASMCETALLSILLLSKRSLNSLWMLPKPPVISCCSVSSAWSPKLDCNGSPGESTWGTNEWQKDRNKLMFKIREAHSMAVVFPKDAAIDALFEATAVFKNPGEA